MSHRDDAETSAESPAPRRAENTSAPGSSEKLTPGQRLGSYEIISEHSRGGFATVYRARHTKLDRPVAIKVLSKFLAHAPEMIQRFENEAKALNRIRHPNIVDVTDFGVLDGGRPYFVMEWLEGKDLRDELRDNGPLDPGRVAAVADDIASALGAAHSADIVHRDLKAANVIMLSGAGPIRCKLLDFGVAKMLESEQDPDSMFVTDMGVRVGTPHAMAPEQVRCESVTAATDVYAFGVLLFELLAGQPPFHDAKSPTMLATMHLSAEPPLISERAKLPRSVDRVIAKCMAKDPADRYQTAAEVATELRAALAAKRPRPDRLRYVVYSVFAVLAAVGVVLFVRAANSFGTDSGPSGIARPPGVTAEQLSATTPGVFAEQLPTDASPSADDDAAPADAAPADARDAAAPEQIDLSRFDLTRGLAWARQESQRTFADATLYRIAVSGAIAGRGHLDLTIHSRTQIEYMFVSPTGAGDACVSVVQVSAGRSKHYAVPRANREPCTQSLIREPTCALETVIARAAARHGMGPKQVAQLRYMQVSGADSTVWRLRNIDGTSVSIPDDCR